MSNEHTILYPTIKGIAKFNTKNLTTGPVLNNVIINQVQFGDSTITPKERVVIPKEFREIEFRYKTPSFYAPELITYEYKLEGYDKKWKSSGTNRFASYTRLAPGNYTFLVRAKNSEGIISENTRALPIFITPYFYEETGMQVTFILLVVAIILFLFWNAQKQAQLREVNLQKEIKLRTIDLQNEKELTEKMLVTVAEQGNELERINKSRSEFFANISHELKTPLTLIKGPVSTLLNQEQNSLSPSTLKSLKLVEKNSDHLNQLIAQLLEIAKSEDGTFDIKMDAFDPGLLIQTIVFQHKNWIDQKNIKIEGLNHSQNAVGISDKKVLEKIISNLLSNALKFTPNKGVIQINYQVINEQLTISIEDSGLGINEKDLPYIFNRFYTSSNKTQENKSGSGIGLAVVKEFTDLLGGSIKVENQKNKGARFSVTIPFEPGELEEKSTITSYANSDFSNSATKLKNNINHLPKEEQPLILIVEDHADIRYFIKETISDHYNIIEAENGKIGLDMARNNLPDLIISDIMMPEMNGMEMLKQLRINSTTDYIPLLLLTAKGSESTRIEGWKEGADAYIAKPFNQKELLYRAQAILANRQKLKQQILKTEIKSDPRVNDQRSSFEIKFEKVVTDNLCEPEFSFTETLDDFAMSLSKFQRLVKEFYGMTPQVYLRHQRLEMAKSLLEQKSGSISEIAYTCGFNSVSYFNRIFKKTYKTTPSDLIQTAF